MSRSYFDCCERRQFADKEIRKLTSKRVRRLKLDLPDGNYYRKLWGDICGQDTYSLDQRRGRKVRKYGSGKRLDVYSLKKFRTRRYAKLYKTHNLSYEENE